MAKVITETVHSCDDCQFQLEVNDELYCSYMNSYISVSEGESFPDDCPLEDE